MRTRGLIIPAAFTAISLVILIGLGAWQWQRRGEKAALIATIQQRLAEAPQPFPPQTAWPTLQADQINYRRVTLSGTFDHAHEAHVFFSLAKPIGGVSGPGYLILTPFRLDAGGTVLVNRGFVPEARKAASTRGEGNETGPTNLTGLMRLPEQRGLFTPADTPAKNIHFVRNPAVLAASLGLGAVAPVIVDQSAPIPRGNLPLPGVTQIDIPNNHLQYALTWWSLAAILAVIFALFARKRPE